MGRGRQQGPKNLTHVVDQPGRLQRLIARRGSEQIRFVSTPGTVDRIVERLKLLGFQIEAMEATEGASAPE